MHYGNAPITEAAIDIFVRLPDGMSLDVLKQTQEAERERYPITAAPYKAEFQFGNTSEQGYAITKFAKTPLGFAFVSPDQKQVFQARLDGFSHNRLAPYLNWNSFRDEAERLWNRYKSIAAPVAIDLLGLHYTNVFDIPLKRDFSEYFQTCVLLGRDLPQTVEGFSLSVQIPFEQFNARLALFQTYAPPRRADAASVLLDIRVFRQIGRAVADFTDSGLWTAFEELRQAKNAAFEGCITDLIREAIR